MEEKILVSYTVGFSMSEEIKYWYDSRGFFPLEKKNVSEVLL